jgi:hypothetical protein
MSDRIAQPDGSVKITHGLSFVTTTQTKRGRYVASSGFDVPAESYADGWITGTLAAGELLAALREEHFDLMRILRDAAAASDSEERRGAGVGFLRTIEAMLYFAADHAQHRTYVARRIESLRAMSSQVREREQIAKRQFAERMHAAKARRRAAKSIGEAAKETDRG